MLVIFARDTNATTFSGMSVYLNGGAGGSSQTELYGNGSSASSYRTTTSSPTFGAPQLYVGRGIPGSTATANIFAATQVHILNYKSSTNKTVLTRNAIDLNGSGFTSLFASTAYTTSAVTSIELQAVTAFASGSTAALYGIKASAA